MNYNRVETPIYSGWSLQVLTKDGGKLKKNSITCLLSTTAHHGSKDKWHLTLFMLCTICLMCLMCGAFHGSSAMLHSHFTCFATCANYVKCESFLAKSGQPRLSLSFRSPIKILCDLT